MSVHTKLMQARLKLAGSDLKKTGENKFAGYKYFELGDFLPAAQAIFAELGLCGVVSFNADIAALTITDTETGGEIVITSPMGSAALKGCHEVQNIGAVETYQRRYLWVSAFEIVEHDALDATTGKVAPQATVTKINPMDGVMDGILPERQTVVEGVVANMREHLDMDDPLGALTYWRERSELTDTGEKAAAWKSCASYEQAAMKKAGDGDPEGAIAHLIRNRNKRKAA